MIHSPMPATDLPFHSPAGTAYRPQWMKSPNLASRNHFILASWLAGAGKGGGRVCARPAEARTVVIAKTREFMRFIANLYWRTNGREGQSAGIRDQGSGTGAAPDA